MKKVLFRVALFLVSIAKKIKELSQKLIEFISFVRVKFIALFSGKLINRFKQFFQKFLAQQNKYFIYLGLILVALAIAGFNLAGNSQQTVSAKENSLLVDLLFDDKDNIETVKNNIAENPNITGSSYISFVSIASASANQALVSSGAAKAKKPKSSLNTTGDSGKIVSKNTTSDSAVKEVQGAKKYAVSDGDTIFGIADKFGIDGATILTENDLYADDIIKPGMELTILPVSGTADKVDKGETLTEIAHRYEVSEQAIMKYNKLVTVHDLEVGQTLIVPNGKREIKERPKPVADPVVLAAASADNNSNTISDNSYYNNETTQDTTQETAQVTSTQATSTNDLHPTNNAFSWGWCTWYAAARRPDVTWMGNAGEWLGNAQAQGRATGRIPAVGAIMVTGESWWGHVAIVEAVNGDSVTVSEMNYAGFGIVSFRTISNRSGVIKGYIY